VVISQVGGANWLMVDASGALMTELKYAGRGGSPLCSETVVTDGDWHRIGLNWEGSALRLYVDDALVAEDTQDGLEDTFAGLVIGCGSTMAPGTFFSGLIDDVRIYNRAVTP
jgi:hypothetical protein